MNEHLLQAIYELTNTVHRIANEIKEIGDENFTLLAALKPRIFLDGNQWCCLYGEDIMQGIVGFGATPQHAYGEFYRAWYGIKPPLPMKGEAQP